MSKKLLSLTIGVFIILYVAFPYYSAYSLHRTILEGDKYELNRGINFKNIRASLKEQINSKIMEETTKNSENPFVVGLAVAFLPKIVDSMIDAYITPSGMSSIISKGKIDNIGSDSIRSSTSPKKTESNEIDLSNVKYAFFSNPTTFLVQIDEVKLIFNLQDWWWKLNEIILPDVLENPKQFIEQNSRDSSSSINEKVDSLSKKYFNSEKKPEELLPLPSGNPADVGTKLTDTIVYTFDSSSLEKWAFFDFSRGSIVSDTSSFKDPKGWDLAFRRAKIASNGGGTNKDGQVEVARLKTTDFDSVTSVPGDAKFIQDTRTSTRADPKNASLDKWYSYNFADGFLKSHKNVYIIKTAEGNYAKMQIINYYCKKGEELLSGCYSLKYVYQGNGSRNLEKEIKEPQNPLVKRTPHPTGVEKQN